MNVLRSIWFLTVLFGVSAALHYYLWKRLHKELFWPEPIATWGKWFFQFMALATPLILIGVRIVPRTLGTILAWFGFTWMGLVFFLFVFTLVREPALRIAKRWLESTQDAPNRQRRLFLARVSAGAVAGLAGLMGVGGILQAYRPLKVRNLPVMISRLRKNGPTFRIALITDLHVGPMIDRNDIERVVALINGQRPDIVAITGDLVDGDVAELREDIAPLAQLNPRYGTFFVTGNHEYYVETDAWIDYLRELKIRTLGNERLTIFHEGEAIDIAGVYDWTAHHHHPEHHHDLNKAMLGRPLSRPVVLLAHQPRAFPEAVKYNVDLQLSGHTHGGQIKPFQFITRLAQPYIEGLHQKEASQIYVSPGTGFWGPPMRVGTRAEITLLELHNNQA